MTERRYLHLLYRRGLVELMGWEWFEFVASDARDSAYRAGWMDYETVAERLEWRRCDEVFSHFGGGHLRVTFEVLP